MKRQALNGKAVHAPLKGKEESGFHIFGTSPVATLVVGPDGTIEYVNQAFQELTGFLAEELVTLQAPYPWLPREEPDESLKNLREARRRSWKRVEKLIRKKNGEQCWTEITMMPVKENGTLTHYFQTLIDITKGKNAEYVTRKQRELLQWNHDVARIASRTDILPCCLVPARFLRARVSGW